MKTFNLISTTILASTAIASSSAFAGKTDSKIDLLYIPYVVGAEATSNEGAHVEFSYSGVTFNRRSEVEVNCDTKSGSLFPLGITTVKCWSVNRGDKTAVGSFEVYVLDWSAPTLNLPVAMELTSRDGSPVTLTYSATAIDTVDGSVAVNCSTPSGASLPVGNHTINCSASDSSRNTASGSIAVSVVQAYQPVAITVPGGMLLSSDSENGIVVNYNVAVYPATVEAVCFPASGSEFPVGETTVNCLAADGTSSAEDSFTVVVTHTVEENTDNTQVSWTAPTTRANGSAMSVNEIAGYKVFVAASNGAEYVYELEGGDNTSIDLADLPADNYAVRISAIDTNGFEGEKSDVIMMN